MKMKALVLTYYKMNNIIITAYEVQRYFENNNVFITISGYK